MRQRSSPAAASTASRVPLFMLAAASRADCKRAVSVALLSLAAPERLSPTNSPPLAINAAKR
ncbi:hypothetical protein D3C78_1513190 [compost metagenome]